MRQISYVEALNEALYQLLESDERAFLIGQGVNSPWYVGNATRGLYDRFGAGRVIDTPVSENGVTGVAVGAALTGLRPVLVFPRMDFMYYAMDQIANHAANWHYMFGGQLSVPLTIWAIINRGGEQSAQHSQAIQAMLAHIPGLKVVAPATSRDAKGLMMAAAADDNPVVYLDDRWLYEVKGEVPEYAFTTPIGKGERVRSGGDVTLASSSFVLSKAVEAAEALAMDGIQADVIDLRSLKPLDEDLLLESVGKTGRLVVVDGGWKTYGVGAELAALAVEKSFSSLKAPVRRVALSDTPAPASVVLEDAYYIEPTRIITVVKDVLQS